MYDINFLNRLSRTLCETHDLLERREAEETLSKLIDSNECLENCLLLLESGQQYYAQVVATGALKRLLNKKINLNTQSRLELSRYLLKYIVDRPTLPSYILNPLCKIFALITKVGWLDKDVQTDIFLFQLPVQELLISAKNSTTEGLLALKLITALVEEANSDEGLESSNKQRKISADFRDNRLLDIFILSLDILKDACTRSSFTKELEEYVSQALDLSYSCTNYDFIGSINDETVDENTNIQIPTKWRPVLIERQVVNLLFDLYFVLPQQIVVKAFQTLVQLASVRRMLFDSLDRQKYLDQIVGGLKRVLQSAQKLSYPDNFHHFCRIISRVKANYQVSELVKCDDFSPLLLLLREFTLQSLNLSHMFTQNSIYYLMSFWSRMAGSLTYARVDVEMIASCIPKVCSAFIQSRVHLCELVVRDGVDDPLEDMGAVKQLMELFTVISRKEYKCTVEELVRHFEESLNVLFRTDATNQEKLIARKQMIWLITMMGAGINGKGTSNNSDLDDDIYDGEVLSRVWKTMQITDQRLERQQPGTMDIQLEFAYIYLMDEFRKAYISDQVQRESQIYEKLSNLGINDDAGVLRLFAQKIITNLKYWGKDEKILSSTLALLNDLTSGYANVRRLLKTEEIQLLLRNHSIFGFVAVNEDISIMRSRTNFYASLMRLLNIELEEDVAIFDQFMAPITEKFTNIYSIFRTGTTTVNETQLRMAVIGFVRDLRGIAVACTKKTNFQLFLNWSLPNVFVIMQESVKLWPDNAEVTTPILKLIAEFTMNRQSRLTYDMHSCTAVILFRHVSKVICEFGNGVFLLPPVNKDQHYKQRVKNVGVVCQVLRNVLSGNYLPFGVFFLYGDTCLSDALDVAFKLFFRLQEENFLVYSKLANCIYYWLDVVTRDCMAYVSKLEERYFIAILRAVHKGIMAVDTTVISSSCTVLDQILDYIFDRLTRPVDVSIALCREPEGDKWKSALEKEPDILNELLISIFTQLLFEEVKCQWSMSRPLLGLIILNNDRYLECKNEFIRQQPAAFQPVLEQAFNRLMDGINNNVTLKNKDNFTQNLSSFRKEIEAILKGGVPVVNQQIGSEQEFGDNMTD